MAIYYGLVRCTILPPRDLFHPVLPVKIHKKNLRFPYVWAVFQVGVRIVVNILTSERALTGTWVTLEVEKANENGYQLLNVKVVWHFENKAQYDKEKKTGAGLFTEYINTFLKVKQEASGWPSWCITANDREKYIAEYADKEGIELEAGKIKFNPGLRALAKLMLNNFWGKFGQRSDLEKTEVVTDVSRLYELLNDIYQTEVRNLRLINEEILEVCYKHNQEFALPNARVNVVIAAFTTCHARLRLYDVLDRLQKRVLYFDTDSIIYVYKPGQWEPPMGDYLGDL